MRNSLLDPPRSRSKARPAEQEGPSLAEILGATIAMHTEFDQGKRRAIATAIARSTGLHQSSDGFPVPPTIARAMLPDTRSVFPETVERTGVGFPASGAGGYGASLATGYSPFIADRQRTRFGPCDMFNWWPVKTREYKFNATTETSLADGSRYSGFNATWEGTAETTVPSAVDSKISQAVFVQNRLLIQTTVSRDIWQDSESLERWLSTIALSEIRNKLEQAVLFGVDYGITGAMNENCAVQIAKGATSGGAITSINIDDMWGGLAEGSSDTAVWHANKATIAAIDKLAVSGQWPENVYVPANLSPMGFPMMKGRPLISLPWCSALGTAGDLILVNWPEYIFTYIRMPGDSPLSFSVDIPRDNFHRGVLGLAPDAVEQRASEHQLFDTDRLAIIWKLRCDARFLWNATCTDYNGGTIGPVVYLQTR